MRLDAVLLPCALTLAALPEAASAAPAPAPDVGAARQRQPAAQRSQGPKHDDHLLGDWAGLRAKLEDTGIDLGLSYTGEAAANVAGGKETGIAYAGELAATLDFDMAAIAGLQGFSAHVAFVNRHGRSTSKLYVGDRLFHAQEIYGAGGGVPVHLVYLFAEQKLADGAVDLKAGRLPVEHDFGTLDHGCDFVSLTICSTRGLGANLGWTAWPRATWGASVVGTVSDTVKLKTGIYEVNPETGGESGFDWSFADHGGIMVPAELEWTPQIGSAGLTGTYKLGAYLDTHRFDEWNTAINGAPLYRTQAPADRTTRAGAYLLMDQQVTGRGDADRGLHLMAGYAFNSPSTALFRHFAFAGLRSAGKVAGRPDDEFGVQVSYGRVSPELTARQRADVALGRPIANDAPGVQTHEEVVEAMYRFVAAPGLAFVPDVQWVHRPSGTDAYPDALVLACRIKAKF